MFTPEELFNCWTGYREPTKDELKAYDAIEIHPVRDLFEGDSATGETWFEVCQPEEADIWSVYLHLKDGGVDCLTDCPTEEAAKQIAEYLGKRWDMEVNL